MSLSLQSFDLHEMLRLGLDLRKSVQGARSVEQAAHAVVRHVYEQCIDAAGARECVLVRFYQTAAYAELPVELRRFADGLMSNRPARPDMQCLTLMATAGDASEWNHRSRSRGHQAIPLPSEEIVEQAPMIAELIRAMGMDLRAVVAPRHQSLGTDGKTYNVFFVPEAEGSPAIPAQEEFVRGWGIRSVLGFGGLLLRGGLYAVILFSRVPIPQASAERFRNIALDLKVALSALSDQPLFDPPAPRLDAL